MSGHPLWVLLAAAIAGLLAVIAALPDPGQPAIIPLGGVLGGFIAATIARVRQWPRDDVRDAGLEGVYWGTAFAIATYLIAVVAGV
jgi:hypothetical protein